MSSNSIVQESTQVKNKPQVSKVTHLSSRNVEPDYLRYEQLKRELSDDLNHHEYTNAVRALAEECGL